MTNEVILAHDLPASGVRRLERARPKVETLASDFAAHSDTSGFRLESYLVGPTLYAIRRADEVPGERPLAVQLGWATLDLGGAVCALAHGDGPTHVLLSGNEVPVPRRSSAKIVPARWQRLLGLALAFRSRRHIEAIGSPPSLSMRGNEGAADEYQYLVVDALKAWVFGDDRWPRLVAAAVNAALDATIAPDFAPLMVAPLRLLGPIASADWLLFRRHLAAALDEHSRYWSRPGNSSNLTGSMSAICTGLKAVARDRGFEGGVECGYTPQYVVDSAPPPAQQGTTS